MNSLLRFSARSYKQLSTEKKLVNIRIWLLVIMGLVDSRSCKSMSWFRFFLFKTFPRFDCWGLEVGVYYTWVRIQSWTESNCRSFFARRRRFGLCQYGFGSRVGSDANQGGYESRWEVGTRYSQTECTARRIAEWGNEPVTKSHLCIWTWVFQGRCSVCFSVIINLFQTFVAQAFKRGTSGSNSDWLAGKAFKMI